jgi:hypothetical protein
MELICPIILESIKVAGITVYGSIYDYNAICEWLETNSTDPLTNLALPSKFVMKVIGSVEYIKIQSETVRANTSTWCYTFKMRYNSPIIYEKLIAMKKNTEVPDWAIYNEMKIKQLGDFDKGAYMKICKGVDPDIDDTIPRPSNTGRRFQFTTIKVIMKDSQFKSELFDFATFNDCIFINCNFSRCRFIGATFNNVNFFKCTFIGEEVSFYKSTCSKLKFHQCKFEHADTWRITTDKKEVEGILEILMLTGDYKVLKY